MKCCDLVKRINYFLKAYNNFYSNLRLYAHVTLYIENNSFWNLSCYWNIKNTQHNFDLKKKAQLIQILKNNFTANSL